MGGGVSAIEGKRNWLDWASLQARGHPRRARLRVTGGRKNFIAKSVANEIGA